MKKISLFGLLLLLLLSVTPVVAQTGATITLLHFSDYHSHAVPFYSEGQAGVAGVARLIGYLQDYAADPNVLIFSGGDMINRGSPAWSDKYQCAEWRWFNGIVDAMALGNHDADYGPELFAQCQSQIDYPILSSNTLAAGGQPLFQVDGKTYRVFDVDGVKIGVFAVTGSDFDALVKPDFRPAAGATFADRVATARQVVETLREEEQVSAVVVIGHALYEDDVALAQTVPGIDVILGTHSHRKETLTPIPNTDTFIISPYQYATYVNKVELSFAGGELTGVSGELVQMSPDRPEDPDIAAQVARMQTELESDPDYADLFKPVGEAAVELSTEGQFEGEAILGNLVMDVIREAAQANMALSTSSSFRQPIPPGPILEEDLRTSMPYTNKILLFDLTGAQVQGLLDFSISRRGDDFFSQVAGVRFNIAGDQAANIELLTDPANPTAGYQPLDPAATYQVAATDFQSLIAAGYKDIFAQGSYVETGLDVRELVRAYFQENSPVSAQLDGRITVGAAAPAAAPAALPESGGQPAALPLSVLLGATLLALGLLARRQTVG